MNATLSRFNREKCLDLERALSIEWLETDGLGGYASSTSLACATRRYHGLLVTCPEGNNKRHVFLSRFEETLRAGDKSFPLSMARYPDVWAPQGHQSIEHFELAPYPTWVYRIGKAEIRREILMVRDSGVVLCRYLVTEPEHDLDLELRPLLPFREADSLTQENEVLDSTVREIPGGIACRPYEGLPEISITVGKAPLRFEADPVWYHDIEYTADEARGYEGREDQFSPGTLHLSVKAGREIVVAVTLGEPVGNPRSLWKKQSAARQESAQGVADCANALVERCELAAQDFLYRTPTGRLGVNAGFPWFLEWGRDTFIALPGLTLARGQVEDCGQALSVATEYLQDGLLPNIFGLSKTDSHYGSVDASLWFSRAVRLYDAAEGSQDRLFDELFPALTEIAESYWSGTQLGIAADEGGLISAGSKDLNPTWMDARTPAGPVTPRDGCAVEINALWYSLLHYLTQLSKDQGDSSATKRWSRRRDRAKKSFIERFWLDDERYLADLWKEGEADTSVRPNMVIAAAEELSPLSRNQRADVVERAKAELLTERGLRTLSPKHPDYVGRYAGNQEQRDGAYHQGTVWPWLLGFYCEASLRASGNRKAGVGNLRALWEPFLGELDHNGINHISEVYSGDVPHEAGGTVAQAWNTAELLRAHALLEADRL